MKKSSTEIVPFDFHGKTVRVVKVLDQDGSHEEWVAKDVCDALEIKQPTRSVEGLDPDEVSSAHLIDSLGREQEQITVTESGLYSLILRSRKPSAREFKRWVTHEVLPAIRAKGYYVAQGAEQQALADLSAKLDLVLQANQQANDRVAQLEQRLAAVEHAHPLGLLDADAKVLRLQITDIAHKMVRLGDKRNFIAVYRAIDNEVRFLVNYPAEKGASWERCTRDQGSKAFSFVARKAAALAKELGDVSRAGQPRQMAMEV